MLIKKTTTLLSIYVLISQTVNINIGVPQGSILGLLLFLLMYFFVSLTLFIKVVPLSLNVSLQERPVSDKIITI